MPNKSVHGCVLYTWPFQPCSRCAGLIIQSGITRVVSVVHSEDRWKKISQLPNNCLWSPESCWRYMMRDDNSKAGSDINVIRDLVYECIGTHNEEVLVQLIYRLEQDYIDIAKLASMGDYKASWTHQEILDYMTYFT